ncbi:hypothetical protein MDAP_000019 [Mitosporidium daphniae]
MQEEARGGSRGGYDQFSWETVKEDRNRICYLGNSIKAPVGRWQVGKDVGWFQKPKEERTDMPIKASLSSSASCVKEEQQLLREKEKEMMASALLYGFGNPLTSTSNLPPSLINSTLGLFENQGKSTKEQENPTSRRSGFERSLSPEIRISTNESREPHKSSRTAWETSSSSRQKDPSRYYSEKEQNRHTSYRNRDQEHRDASYHNRDRGNRDASYRNRDQEHRDMSYRNRGQDHGKSSRRWSKNESDRNLDMRNSATDKYSSREKDRNSPSRQDGNSAFTMRPSKSARFRDRTTWDDLYPHSTYGRE